MHALLLWFALFQDQQEDIKKLQQQMEQMKKQMEDQQKLFSEQLKQMQEKIDGLKKETKRLELQIPEESEVPPQPQTPPQGPNVFNPTVSVVTNWLARYDSKHVFVDNDPTTDRVDNTLSMRETELDFRAAVDPFADAVGIISVGEVTQGKFEVDVEEAYAVIKRLPVSFLDPPPLQMKFKLGRFRPAFGNINILHRHDLPQSDRPLVVQEFLGAEGFNADGASVNMFLPWFEEESTMELTTEVFQGGSPAVASGTRAWAYLGNLRFFKQIDDQNTLQLSGIVHYGTTDNSANFGAVTYSLDALYKWKKDEWESFIFGAQAFYTHRRFPLPNGGALVDNDGTPVTDAGGNPIVDSTLNGIASPLGYYAFAQYQLDRPWFVGVRWDDTEAIANDHVERRAISPYITWYPDEFLRFRLGYEHQWSDLAFENNVDSVFFEINWIFGAHPPEPFWVNR